MRTAWHGRHHATGFCHLFTQGGVHSRYKKMKREREREKKTNLSTYLKCRLWKPHVSYVKIVRNKVYFAWKLLISISFDEKYKFSPVSRASFQPKAAWLLFGMDNVLRRNIFAENEVSICYANLFLAMWWDILCINWLLSIRTIRSC